MWLEAQPQQSKVEATVYGVFILMEEYLEHHTIPWRQGEEAAKKQEQLSYMEKESSNNLDGQSCFFCHHQLSLDGGSKSTFRSSLGWT